MKICFAFWQNPSGYSGGRYHAWLLALSLGESGHDVTVWTNRAPSFANDFGVVLDKLTISIDPRFYEVPHGPLDCLVICPHQGVDKHFHYKWLLAADSNRIPVIFVSYETPNWLSAEGMPTRGLLNWWSWSDCGDVAARILSSSNTGDTYARTWYNGQNSDRFVVCSPPCNTIALGDLDNPRDIDLLVFARAGARDFHKGGHLLPELILGLPAGTRVMVFGESSRLCSRVREATAVAARRTSLNLSFSGDVNDVEKLRLFARARVVASLSLFEGFGFTAVEARVSGARLVAFALPVFQELHGGVPEVRLVPRGNLKGFISAVCESLSEDEQMSIQNARLARDRFSWRRSVEQFESAVSGIAFSSPASRSKRVRWHVMRWVFAAEASLRPIGRAVRRWSSRQ